MNPDLQHDLIQIIQDDLWRMDVLCVVRDLCLKDGFVGAGFVRNKIWDHLHGFPSTDLNDIDVIYFDPSSVTSKDDTLIEQKLKTVNPKTNWSVKNQARMHIRNGHEPYANCLEALSYWPETATAVAVRLTSENQIECIVPFGLDDLFNLLIKPSPNANLDAFRERIRKKDGSKNGQS